MLKSLTKKLFGNNKNRKPRSSTKPDPKVRPQMEALEDRSLMSVTTNYFGSLLQVQGSSAMKR